MRAVVTGGSGFIGGHLIKYLKEKNYWVRNLDIKEPEFIQSEADENILVDLRYPANNFFNDVDEVYHLAADMGGIGFIETHKSEIVFNNTMMDMLVLKSCQEAKVNKFFYSSSACIYPRYLQDTYSPKKLGELDAYPAQCEDGYGWEKLMMERACQNFAEDYGMKVYVARFHNIYGPKGTYDGGREKSPAALCRKIAKVPNHGVIEVWGNGMQVRSYCYIDDCVSGIYKLVQSDYHNPINIGSDREVTIDELIDIIAKVSGKKFSKVYDIKLPQGVDGRNADISLAESMLGWKPKVALEEGIERLYKWIYDQTCR